MLSFRLLKTRALSTMTTPAKSRASSSIPLQSLLTAVSNTIRWQVFDELIQHGGMTTLPLAKKIGVPFSTLTKHLQLLKRLGLLDQGMGKIYSIPERFRVPGERALDFGPVVLHLDRGQV
jgi:predicted transcriptional regulator